MNQPTMPTALYRFRSTAALLGKHQELEKQEIYLAAPEQLNDPMEGYKDVFWHGDEVLWRNFFRQYVLSLLDASCICHVISDDHWEEPRIAVSLSPEDLPTDKFRELYAESWKEFAKTGAVVEALDQVVRINRPLRRDGVLFYLNIVHSFALRAVFGALQRAGFTPARMPAIGDDAIVKALQQMGEILQRPDLDAAMLDAMFVASNRVWTQLRLSLRFNWRSEKAAPKKSFLITEFPGRHLEGLVRDLIHPPWFTACFSTSCTDASMWGTYGVSHSGVALKFRVAGESGVPALNLRSVIGSSSTREVTNPIWGIHPFRFKRVNYSGHAPEVDFFKFLGRLPHGKIQRSWIEDDLGRGSTRLKEAFVDLEEWRRELWRLFEVSATTKLADWQHEDEYRIVVSDLIGNLSQYRHVTYAFEDLIGVVFGIQTPEEDKLKIIEIIEQKCRDANRSDFEFLQVQYSSGGGGKLVAVPMPLLRFDQVQTKAVEPDES